MKPVYSNIAIKTGVLNPGHYKVQLVPREWLATDPVVAFNTGTVLLPVTLLPGRQLLELEFTPESYDYDDKPKSNRGGPYHETTFTGLLNNLDVATLQVLNTMEYHQVVAILHDRQKRQRICGNSDAGMIFTFGQKIATSSNGTEIIQVSLSMESERPAPFYLQ